MSNAYLQGYENFVRMSADHSPAFTIESGPEDAVSKSNLAYLALGLAGESGETVDKIKKHIRNTRSFELDNETKQGIVFELGDILWYLTAIADKLGVGIEDVIEANMEKIRGRRARGTVCAQGDVR